MPFVDYQEVMGSPTYQLTRKGITAKRTLQCAWNDVDLLVAEFNPRPGNIFATFPGRPLLWVDTIDIAPWDECPPLNGPGEMSSLARYSDAKVSVNYKTVEWEGDSPSGQDNSPRQGGDPKADNETYLSHKVTVGGEFMILSNQSLQWGTPYNPATNQYWDLVNNKPLDPFPPAAFPAHQASPRRGGRPRPGARRLGQSRRRFAAEPVRAAPPPAPPNAFAQGFVTRVNEEASAGLLIPTIEHTLSWHFVLFPPWTAMRKTVGCVNDAVFAGCPPETLLFTGCEASIDFSTGENKYWLIEYKFVYKNTYGGSDVNVDTGWNCFYRPESGNFERLFRKERVKVNMVRGAPGNPAEMVRNQESQEAVKDIYKLKDFRPLFRPSLF